ncbi:MAG: C4-dicarboxylate transporter DcuC [Bacteroidales bacterium]|nr:C4-dicarboxylate transporter DcuC [Bacteroidales bacterium]
MILLSLVLSVHFIFIAALLLFRKYSPQSVLLILGAIMLVIAVPLGIDPSINSLRPQYGLLSIFNLMNESFLLRLSGSGFMIMVVGGFVAYMNHIGASDALVYVSLQPLSIFKKFPYFASIMVIPIGQLLFMCIPSATGLGLLLVVSIMPVLLGLGVSRLSAVSVITACTVFDLGPASANTNRASELLEKDILNYFIHDQLPLTIPLTIIMMVLYYFFNRYFDKKEGHVPVPYQENEIELKVPVFYSILPLLPLVILLLFSSVFAVKELPVSIDTTTAMLITLFIALVFEFVRTRKLKDSISSLNVFWTGMGKIFVSVVSLVIAAEIFAKGLISLGFISSLVYIGQHIGLQASSIVLVFTGLIFATAVLTGSGSATFFSFAPLAVNIANNYGMESLKLILPMQMASGMGRASSPISGVVVASSDIAKVQALSLAKRNAFPLVSLLIIMLVFFSLF